MSSNTVIKQKLPKRNIVVSLMILVLLSTHCAPIAQQFGIIFSANLDGNQDLFRASSPNFQSLERLTFSPADTEKNLKITRNGEQILFSVLGPYITNHTYVLDSRTKKYNELGNFALGQHSAIPLAWSIDENQAVLLDLPTNKLYTWNLDEKNAKELKIPPYEVAGVYEFSYSPDGKQILYSLLNKYANHPPASFFYDLRTKVEIQLGTSAAACLHPNWSPSGKQILLYCDLSTDSISENSHIYILDVTGNDPVTIKETVDLPCGAQFAWSPGAKFAWSPDGKLFVAAYCKTNDNPWSLILFKSDGSQVKVFPSLGILENRVYISELAWSPDGQKILYIAGKGENSLNIYEMDVDGSNNHAITTQPSNYSQLTVFIPGP